MMKTLLFALSLVPLPMAVSAQGNESAAIANSLFQALQSTAAVQANCPQIIGVSVGNTTDKSTWTVEYVSAPDPTCTGIVAGVIAALPIPPMSMQIVSATYPALNGTYPIDSADAAICSSRFALCRNQWAVPGRSEFHAVGRHQWRQSQISHHCGMASVCNRFAGCCHQYCC